MRMLIRVRDSGEHANDDGGHAHVHSRGDHDSCDHAHDYGEHDHNCGGVLVIMKGMLTCKVSAIMIMVIMLI